jgi:hypothetical protein
MPQSPTLSMGMEGPQEAMAVASSAHAHGAEVTARGTIDTRHADLNPSVRTRPSTAHHLLFGAAAGPCGSWRAR